mmetsp:Transcript_88434/g.230866  ORF Transcript_88434/g.230866 Transcript_88434/m.230866 type:complete len:82 (-) Transcript_88434:15-260(-)
MGTSNKDGKVGDGLDTSDGSSTVDAKGERGANPTAGSDAAGKSTKSVTAATALGKSVKLGSPVTDHGSNGGASAADACGEA